MKALRREANGCSKQLAGSIMKPSDDNVDDETCKDDGKNSNNSDFIAAATPAINKNFKLVNIF